MFCVSSAIDDPSIKKEDIECIQKIRERLGKDLLPFFDDDLSLVRWSVAWNRNLDEIEPRLRFAMRTLRSMDLDNENVLSFDEISRECNDICPAAKYMAGKILGFDKNGCVVYLQKLLDFEGLFHSVKYSDMYKKMITETQRIVQLFRAEEKKSGRMLGNTIISDMSGFSLSQAIPMNQIVPMMEYMQVLAEEAGTYKFVFDNTHSKLRTKTIRYNIEIV